jgi:hypothetical protein
MQKGRQILVHETQVAVTGRLFRTARLSHEWFEFLDDPPATIKRLQLGKTIADLFTFLGEAPNGNSEYPFQKEVASASILTITTFEQWRKNLDCNVRNKISKAERIGVELRPTELSDAFVKGVKNIYNESPIRQGRKFWHYGKGFAQIKHDLSSFPDRTFLIGAYYKEELIGFVKLFQGNNILRTVHIIANLSHRDKPVQDALIAKAVEICDQKRISYLHYGNWSRGGLGAFKVKHGFKQVDLPRYFVPLTLRGRLMLGLNLHRKLRERVPEKWMTNLVALRTRWNSLRYRAPR